MFHRFIVSAVALSATMGVPNAYSEPDDGNADPIVGSVIESIFDRPSALLGVRIHADNEPPICVGDDEGPFIARIPVPDLGPGWTSVWRRPVLGGAIGTSAALSLALDGGACSLEGRDENGWLHAVSMSASGTNWQERDSLRASCDESVTGRLVVCSVARMRTRSDETSRRTVTRVGIPIANRRLCGPGVVFNEGSGSTGQLPGCASVSLDESGRLRRIQVTGEPEWEIAWRVDVTNIHVEARQVGDMGLGYSGPSTTMSMILDGSGRVEEQRSLFLLPFDERIEDPQLGSMRSRVHHLQGSWSSRASSTSFGVVDGSMVWAAGGADGTTQLIVLGADGVARVYNSLPVEQCESVLSQECMAAQIESWRR